MCLDLSICRRQECERRRAGQYRLRQQVGFGGTQAIMR